MRMVTSPNFCKVCTETLWLHLLRGINFIDEISESCVQRDHSGSSLTSSSSSWSKVIDLHLVPLAQLRRTPVSHDESYSITWKKDGNFLPQFTNKTRIEMDDGNAMGRYTMQVKFATEEIRVESNKLVSGMEYTVRTKCEET